MARHTRRRLVRFPLQLCLLALTLSLVYEAAVRYAPTALTAPFATAAPACEASFGSSRTFAAGINPFSVALGDFNNDSYRDLAVANYSSGDVSILLGNGNGTFQTAVSYAAGTNPIYVTVGDFDANGRTDLAVA
ncbi:MAG: VCBS repeat-containing protein, partial [Pyrinomonadaceae bacterium]|nr:VCBS repeat-containing protein [Pyrinomonadaceae bacterium]